VIRFPFRERKAAQAAARILSQHSNEEFYLLLIKLLYLADRRALIERGAPITGDRMVSMPRGPVLSQIKDLFTMEDEPLIVSLGTVWREYISAPAEWKVRGQKQNPERDELSDYEISILNDVNSEFGAMNRFKLSELTHGLPEFTDPNGSSLAIDPAEILRHIGKSSEEIEAIAESAEQSAFIRKVLAAK
jgi:uncharacterized phage-associated protein